MISRAIKAAQNDALLQEFVPCPKELSDTAEANFSDLKEKAEQLARQEHNRKTYGYSSWYDFAIGEWGTKWDISNGGDDYKIEKVNDGYKVTLYFDTAWSPPINFYDKLLDIGFNVEAMYHEPGVAFCGQYFEGSEETYELSDLTSEEIRDQLPSELDEMFGISEQLAEWEAEQEDDR